MEKSLKNWIKMNFIHCLCIIIILSMVITAVVCIRDAMQYDWVIEPAESTGSERVRSASGEPAWTLTEAEISLAGRLISTECSDEPFLCRVAAASVLLNRLKSTAFPDNMVNVVFSRNAFVSVEKGQLGEEIAEEDLEQSIRALRVAMSGEDPTGGALYFAKAETAEAEEISASFAAGNMVFGWR